MFEIFYICGGYKRQHTHYRRIYNERANALKATFSQALAKCKYREATLHVSRFTREEIYMSSNYAKLRWLTRPAKVPTDKASRGTATGRRQWQQPGSHGDSESSSSREGAAVEPPKPTSSSSISGHQHERTPRDHVY